MLGMPIVSSRLEYRIHAPRYPTAVLAPIRAVISGRSRNATVIGIRKKIGSNHVVAPPEATHIASTATTSIAVEAQPNHQRSGNRSTIVSQIAAVLV
jgi:hypothetical protein